MQFTDTFMIGRYPANLRCFHNGLSCDHYRILKPVNVIKLEQHHIYCNMDRADPVVITDGSIETGQLIRTFGDFRSEKFLVLRLEYRNS
jgi:hypothetical protein